MQKLKTSQQQLIGLILSVALLWPMPTPEGLSVQAYHMFLLFLATIIAAILRPMPMGAVSLLGLLGCLITKTISIEDGLAAFGQKTVWLVVFAFLVSKGFAKTGLGKRIAYIFLGKFGKSSMGLGYSLVFTDFLFAPFVPSNTARGGGILFPIVQSICNEVGSRVEDKTQHKMGSFLMALSFQANTLTSALFLTSMAANPLILNIVLDFKLTSWNPTWMNWFLLAIVPGIINLLLLPQVVFRLQKPSMDKTPQIIPFAKEKLRQMGPMSYSEKVMGITFIILLFLWILGSNFGIDATTATLVGLVILLVTDVLTWEDILSEKSAYDSMIWLAILLTMASALNSLGGIAWFSHTMKTSLMGVPPLLGISLLALLYYFSHYLFASMTAHISSLFAAFVAVALTLFPNNPMAVWPFIISSNLCGGLTHYGTGSAPVFYGANYLSLKEWWRVGFFVAIFNICLWVIVGLPWWKFLMSGI